MRASVVVRNVCTVPGWLILGRLRNCSYSVVRVLLWPIGGWCASCVSSSEGRAVYRCVFYGRGAVALLCCGGAGSFYWSCGVGGFRVYVSAV